MKEKDTENLINLTLPVFNYTEILKRGFSLDQIAFIKTLDCNVDIDDLCKDARISNIKNTCIRKGLLTEDLKITVEGKSLIDYLNKTQSIKLPKKKLSSTVIDTFWKAFPSTDTFEYKGKKFQGSRALKTSKEDCKVKLEAILNEGDHTLEDIIKAIEYDVLMKKEQSYKTGQNKLTYIQNSLTYLRQRSFEPFIELIKEDKHIKITQNTEFDGINL